MDIVKTCYKCNGAGSWTQERHEVPDEVHDPCPTCNGSGHLKVLTGIDEDIVDKLNDILDKCNDIFEKVNE